MSLAESEQATALAPDTGERGKLTIHERVVDQIATTVAAEVTEWTYRPSGWDRIGGQGLPHADSTITGRHARISMAVAARPGRPLSDLTADVRHRVATRVSELTGLVVDQVDVRVTRLAPDQGDVSGFLPAASRPASPGSARRAGIVLAFALVAAGAAGVYDALVELDVVGGPALVRSALDWLDGLTPQPWMVPAGVALAAVGLWFLIAGLLPRPRRSLPVSSVAGVYASRKAIEGLAVDTATRHPGVVGAKATARRTAVITRLRTDGEAKTADEVRAALQARLDGLAGPPEMRVPVKRTGGDP